MPTLDATARATYRLMSEGGRNIRPADSLSGYVPRDKAEGQPGGRIASFERFYDYFINHVPPPGEITRLDPGFRDKLRMHPDVQAAMRKRELSVASFPWDIEANPSAKDQASAKAIAEYAKWVWGQIPRSQLLYQQLQAAVLEGGIGHEWVWHREANGVERPVRFFPVHQSCFLFDRLGNLALKTRESPIWGEYLQPDPADPRNAAPMGGLVPNVAAAFPAGKFMYHVYRQEPGTWENPENEGYLYYGVGEDVAIYYPVAFDVFALRGRMKWLEKYGDPPIDLYYPNGWPSGIEDARAIATSTRQESFSIIPRIPNSDAESLFKLVQRDVPSMSYDAFERFSDGWAMRRINAILLGDGGESQKEDTGGYSDHVSRKESGLDVWLRWDATNIAATITAQILPPIVLGRFPALPPSYWPIFKLEPKEERDRSAEMEIVQSAAQYVPISKEWVYEASGIPKPADGQETIGGPGSPMDPAVQAQQRAQEMAQRSGLRPQEQPKGPGGRKPGDPIGQALRKPIGMGPGAGEGSVAKGPRQTLPALPAPGRTMPRNQG